MNYLFSYWQIDAILIAWVYLYGIQLSQEYIVRNYSHAFNGSPQSDRVWLFIVSVCFPLFWGLVLVEKVINMGKTKDNS